MPLRVFAENRALADQWNYEYIFPRLSVTPAFDSWCEECEPLLSLRTPASGVLTPCGKKYLYQSCVKVLNMCSLAGVRESRKMQVFASDLTPKGRWRVLYKPPVEKHVGDLRWRMDR